MSRKNKKKKRYRGFWIFIRFQIFLILLVAGALAYYFFGGYAEQVQQLSQEAKEMVRLSTKDTFRASQTSVVYDANGRQITTLKGEKDVYYVKLEEIPINVTAAITSIEDKKFYSHSGIDIKAIIRAVFAMIRDGEVSQGGSTITQQLARTVFLNQEKTWQRKMEEIFIATELEKKYSKNEILEFYLNNIYFGNGYYGIQAASKGYFDTEVTNLNLSQIAYLCAIPNNPTLYDPVTNNENTLKRRNRILDQMVADQKITQSACDLAKADVITLKRPESVKNNFVETYTYYCATRALMSLEGFEFQTEFEDDEAEQEYNDAYESLYKECEKSLYTGGYRIYTSFDLDMQEQLQETVDQNLAEFEETNDEGIYTLQGAAVCIDNKSGFVKAIVGGRSQDYNGYTLNRAYQSFRQPGSAIKPLIVYTPILERGYTADTIVVDEPIEDGPSNASKNYAGEVTLRYAVEQSINTVAWKLFDELTPSVGLSYLKKMNFAKLSKEDERTATALGGFTTGASPVEMAAAYETLVNGGKYRRPTCIVKILDASDSEVYVSSQEETVIYKENSARTMTEILTGVLTRGTAAGQGLELTASAGKTGTTNSNKDGWFVGYTKYYTTSVWVGYDMPKELTGLKGSSYPASIWHSFMTVIHEGLPYADFIAPAGTHMQDDPEESNQTDTQRTDDVNGQEADNGEEDGL